jgi:hypothetical protein
MPKYCKGKCGRKISHQNKTGYCEECFGRFVLSPKDDYAAGAAVTYFINVLHIANIFIIATQFGENSHEVDMFNFYYGPLCAMAWIVSYPPNTARDSSVMVKKGKQGKIGRLYQ